MGILLDAEENPYMEADGRLKFTLDTPDIAYDKGAKTQLKKVVGWGDEECPHLIGEGLSGEKIHWQSKKECPECWQALLEEAGLNKGVNSG